MAARKDFGQKKGAAVQAAALQKGRRKQPQCAASKAFHTLG